MKNIIILIFCSLLLISCNEDSTSPDESVRSLRGIVKDINGNLLSNVDVFLIFDFEPTTIKTNKYTNPDSVVLSSFTASISADGKVILHWSTGSELNNRGFEIERRRIPENQFITIGFVEGSGTTSEPLSYSFKDSEFLSGTLRYRLKQIDFDGSFNYSGEVEVDIVPPLDFLFRQNYPNPFSFMTKIIYSLPNASNVKILVHSFFIKDTILVLLDEIKYPGYHLVETDKFGLLPNNLYELEFIAEYDSHIFKSETLIMKNYSDTNNIITFDRPFTQTNNGEFLIDYDKMPFENTFNYTEENSDEVLGKIKVKPQLTLVLFKEGFKTLVKTLNLNINSYGEEEFTLIFN